MIKPKEIAESLEKYEKFLIIFAAKILKSLKEDRRELEEELLNIIKGRSYGLPLDIMMQYLDKVAATGDFHQKAVRALYRRHLAVLRIVEITIQEVGQTTAHTPLLLMKEMGDIYEQAFALVTLAFLGHAPACEILKEDMKRFSRVLRYCILSILERSGDAEWANFFISHLEDSEPEVAGVAASALGKCGNPAFAKNLLPFLSHTYEPLVISTIKALGVLKAQEAVLPLMELSISTKSNRVRATTTTALGEIPEKKTIPVLIKFLDHHDPRVRANAIMALTRKFLLLQWTDEETLKRMKLLLNDPEHRVRADAIQSLWELGRVESIDTIEEMLKDPNPFARSSGAYLCGKLKLFQLKDSLGGLTSDTSWNVRKTAAIALLGLGTVGRGTLEELADSGTPDQQICAVMALSLSVNSRGIDNLFSAAHSDRDLTELATELLFV